MRRSRWTKPPRKSREPWTVGKKDFSIWYALRYTSVREVPIFDCLNLRDAISPILHHIRSYEKFTSEGMNYFYGDLYELFEKTFPSWFGGGPGDYQLVEEEDGNGQTRLSLVIHPRVGSIDEEKLLTRLYEALSNGSRGNRFMAGIWQGAGTLRVKRQAPHASPRGKILPLHIHQ